MKAYHEQCDECRLVSESYDAGFHAAVEAIADALDDKCDSVNPSTVILGKVSALVRAKFGKAAGG